MINTNS